jgi:phage recombination protein Bet
VTAALAPSSPHTLARSQAAFSTDQVELVKRTICKDASDDELQLFLGVCKKTGLDPFAKQIYAIRRWNSDAGGKVMSIQIGIDGFRLIAERSDKYDGQDGPYWCGGDGTWHDVWLADGEFPVAAKVTVYKKGSSRPFTGIAHWDEYVQTDKNGEPTKMWRQMPAGQLAKCAEALALRKAFPQELSGMYSVEEMQQSENETPYKAPARQLPSPSDGPSTVSKDEFSALMARKGFTWNKCLGLIDAKQKTTYLKDKSVFDKVSQDHLIPFSKWLKKQPDVPQPPEADEDYSEEGEQRPDFHPTGATQATNTAPGVAHSEDGDPPPGDPAINDAAIWHAILARKGTTYLDSIKILNSLTTTGPGKYEAVSPSKVISWLDVKLEDREILVRMSKTWKDRATVAQGGSAA